MRRVRRNTKMTTIPQNKLPRATITIKHITIDNQYIHKDNNEEESA